jgi:hypothetical protein
MELEKLSEESLTRQPEEVFDILCKLGEGSYGSVFKALHKESRQILAIKQVCSLGRRLCPMLKHFYVQIYLVLVSAKPFQPSLRFVGKVRSMSLSGTPEWCFTRVSSGPTCKK